MEDRIRGLENRVQALEEGLEANTKTTNAIKRDTEQVLLILKASKLGAGIIQWLATVGGGVIVAWAAFKGIVGH